MSKLIVEMEMPKTCAECPISIYFHTNCLLQDDDKSYEQFQAYKKNERPSWCPIKGVLPDEHGNLVDADTVLWEVLDSEGIVPPMPVTIGDVIEGYDVPIVISAERKDDENH